MSNYGYEELPSAFPTLPVHRCVPLTWPDKQIRVLELDPVRSRDPNLTSELHGRLHVLSPPSDEDYTALSYVWAQKDPGTSERENRLVIHCDDHQHEARIGPNCWSALWHLSKTRGSLRVWVDALCVEQGNDEEKAQQIPLMRDIYSSAHTTYFWLGEATKGTDEAMDYLSLYVLSVSSGGFGDTFRAALKILIDALPKQVSRHESVLDEVFKRPWIERLWTLQECLLAQNGIVICGEKSICWQDLICALEALHHPRDTSSILHFQGSHKPWLNLARLSCSKVTAFNQNSSGGRLQLDQATESVEGLKRRVQSQLRRLILAKVYVVYVLLHVPLLALPSITPFRDPISRHIFRFHVPGVLLAWMAFAILGSMTGLVPRMKYSFPGTQHPIVEELRTRKATDPNDMYYGVAGILNDDCPLTKGTLYDHYRRLCTILIKETTSLDMLLLASATSDENFPSWVIDWHSATPQIWDKALFYTSLYELDDLLDPLSRVLKHWPRFYKRYTVALPPFMKPKGSEINGHQDIGSLMTYQGPAPDSKPLWEFRNYGKDLCVRGLLLTHISAHGVPLYTEIGATHLFSAAQALFVKRGIDNSASSEAIARCATMSDRPIGITEHLAKWPVQNKTILFLFTELRMLTAYAISIFSGMSRLEGMKIESCFILLVELMAGKTELLSQRAKWWEKLLLIPEYAQSTNELECLFEAAKLLRHHQASFMSFLRREGLILVRCEATASWPGGLGFAGAAAQEGDTVALVSGVPLPLILRGCGQRGFKLIGPLFSPGVMDGELQHLLTPESLSEIVLV